MTRPDQREREEKGGLSLQSLEQIVAERGGAHTAQQKRGADFSAKRSRTLLSKERERRA